mmetsp:Transcript_72708/g.224574  ORF Transcript_72708/g.224574 Transcript_72708/m.224574 type:complete len:482 (+) Transcript_72708:50-1495(+)
MVGVRGDCGDGTCPPLRRPPRLGGGSWAPRARGRPLASAWSCAWRQLVGGDPAGPAVCRPPATRCAARRGVRLALLLPLAARSIELNSEETLRDAVSKRPRDSAARMKLVRWHLQWGELRKATAELKGAVEQDPANAWAYTEQLGDLHFFHMRDERGAEAHYKEALRVNPASRHSLLQFGTLSIWRDRRAEAEDLFQRALKAGLLSDVRQRPLELSRQTPISKQPWHDLQAVPVLAKVAQRIAAVAGDATAEYLKWAKTRARDGEPDGDGLEEPSTRGRWRHFWIHRPRFERGIWRDACSYKTPKTCALLGGLNNTGRAGEKLVVLQADFDVLGPGGRVRAHCHANDRETYLVLPLLTPRLGPNRTSTLLVGGERRAWVEGRPELFDASFEHEEAVPAPADSGAPGVDYSEELRRFYVAGGMPEKAAGVPEALVKWSGQEEKMMRKVREKYTPGWRGERVALRLLLRSSILKAAVAPAGEL